MREEECRQKKGPEAGRRFTIEYHQGGRYGCSGRNLGKNSTGWNQKGNRTWWELRTTAFTLSKMGATGPPWAEMWHDLTWCWKHLFGCCAKTEEGKSRSGQPRWPAVTTARTKDAGWLGRRVALGVVRCGGFWLVWKQSRENLLRFTDVQQVFHHKRTQWVKTLCLNSRYVVITH